MSEQAPTAHDAQATAEDVPAGDVVEFMGSEFTLPERVSYMAFLIFAKAAKKGLGTEDEAGMAAMYDMIHGCLDPADEERFDNLALEKRASGEEIFDFVAEVMERVSARPTKSPGDSSQQAPSTSQRLKATSRLPAGAENLAPVGALLR